MNIENIIAALIGLIATLLSAYFAYSAKKHGDDVTYLLEQSKLKVEKGKNEVNTLEAVNAATLNLIEPLNQRIDEMEVTLKKKDLTIQALEEKVDRGDTERAGLHTIIEQLRKDRQVLSDALQEVISVALENIEKRRDRGQPSEHCHTCDEADQELEKTITGVVRRVSEK